MKHLATALCLVFVLVSCGGSESDGAAAASSDAQEASASTTTSTTQAATTTTTAPMTTTSTSTTTTSTTTTTLPPSPEELREEFLSSLRDDGWQTYVDEVVGWSILVPGDWEVEVEDPGGAVLFMTPQQGGLLVVNPALDATSDDVGSFDYLYGNVEFAIDGGMLRAPADSDWFWLDADFDGSNGLHDIEGVELSFAIDFSTGEALSEDSISPTWWYAYYDPSPRPAYGYIMQTIGVSSVLFEYADEIFLSFEPPAGYPAG